MSAKTTLNNLLAPSQIDRLECIVPDVSLDTKNICQIMQVKIQLGSHSALFNQSFFFEVLIFIGSNILNNGKRSVVRNCVNISRPTWIYSYCEWYPSWITNSLSHFLFLFVFIIVWRFLFRSKLSYVSWPRLCFIGLISNLTMKKGHMQLSFSIAKQFLSWYRKPSMELSISQTLTSEVPFYRGSK